jgi:hypothetical protein
MTTLDHAVHRVVAHQHAEPLLRATMTSVAEAEVLEVRSKASCAHIMAGS